MNYQDLKQFKEQVADPRMRELFDKTIIPEGTCYIHDLEVLYLDGRSHGVDTQITAFGITYREGKAELYEYSETDVELNDFLTAHKDCLFLSDGVLHVEDEVEEFTLETTLRRIRDCGKLFHQMQNLEDIHIVSRSIEFEKLQHLLGASEAAQKANAKPTLSDQIQSAAARGAEASLDAEPARSGAETHR